MITCIAIDDEPRALEILTRYCQKSNLVDLKAVFREPVKAIDYINRENPDLIFLDINMPDIDGMQLVQTLVSKPKIIFTTAYSHHAVESYSLNAVDYLLKPISFERFLAAVNKAIGPPAAKNNTAARDDEQATIFIKSGAQTFQVRLAEILYLEKEGNYITMQCREKQILIRENMGEIFDLVPATEFVRVHKSYVVAVRHITMIEVHQLHINGKKIPIGSTYREALRARLGLK